MFWKSSSDKKKAAEEKSTALPTPPPMRIPSAETPADVPSRAAGAPPAAAPATTTAASAQDKVPVVAGIQASLAAPFGKIVSVLMNAATHSSTRLVDMTSLVVPAVYNNQFVIADGKPEGQTDPVAVGVVLWASVSDEVDRRLVATAANGIKLAPAEWRSGDNVWLVEVIGTQRVVDAMMRQLIEGPLKGRAFKARRRLADGRVAVETIDPAQMRKSA